MSRTVDAAVRAVEGGIYLNVHVQPGARKARLCGMHGEAIKIAVREAAQDGKANEALIRFVAALLDCPKQRVAVTTGQSSRRKRLFVAGDATALIALLKERLRHV